MSAHRLASPVALALWIFTVAIALIGCGGGGSGGESPGPLGTPNQPAGTAPSITAHPQDATVDDGEQVQFAVTAAGTAPLTYQWRRDGVNIPGATGITYAFVTGLTDDQASFDVAVTNSVGTTLSFAGFLHVTSAPPSITTQPQAQAILAGTAATFTVSASGTSPLSFQWLRDNVPISGATSASYTTSVLTLADSGHSYSVVVSNSVGSANSNSVALQVDPIPNAVTINSQPTSVAVTEGGVATFTVAVNGTQPLAYQWKRNGVPIPGEYETSLVVAPATAFNNGDQYSVEVRNALGLVVSTDANLAVTRGDVSLALGSVGGWGNLDGPARLAKFGCSRGIVGDGAGNYFVTDALNDTIRRISAAGTVSTFAGSSRQRGSADGTGANARFYKPTGITMDSSGSLYVADSGNQTIRKITSAGMVTTLAGNVGNPGASNGAGAAAQFRLQELVICDYLADSAIAADLTGNIYVADTGNHAIRKITPVGNVSTLAGVMGQSGSADGAGSTARFNHPTGLVLDATQNLYVLDNSARVRKITLAGEVTTLPGSAPASGAIAIDSNGDVYVSTFAFSDVYRHTASGLTLVAGDTSSFRSANGRGSEASFNFPSALAFTPTRDLLVVDSTGVRRIDSNQGVSTFAGGLGAASGFSDGPASTALVGYIVKTAADAAGNVYFTDANNNSIRQLSTAGVVATIAGVHGQPGDADGAIANARFTAPNGIAVDALGNLFVSDNSRHTIRKISTNGQVSTIGGVAGVSGSTDGAVGISKFNQPMGVALDAFGAVYVADRDNHVIRKIDSSGVASTLAGAVGAAGSTNGLGALARFDRPESIAIDASGNLYLTEAGSFAIRHVTPAGDVTTFAGSTSGFGTVDGTAANARFSFPHGLSVAANGDVYLADGAGTIRRIAAGMVSTVAGSSTNWGIAIGALPGSFTELTDVIVLPSTSGAKLMLNVSHGLIQITLP